jgi:hypothetical protein
MAQSYFTKTHASVAPVQEPSIESAADRAQAATDAQDAYIDQKDRFVYHFPPKMLFLLTAVMQARQGR